MAKVVVLYYLADESRRSTPIILNFLAYIHQQPQSEKIYNFKCRYTDDEVIEFMGSLSHCEKVYVIWPHDRGSMPDQMHFFLSAIREMILLERMNQKNFHQLKYCGLFAQEPPEDKYDFHNRYANFETFCDFEIKAIPMLRPARGAGMTAEALEALHPSGKYTPRPPRKKKWYEYIECPRCLAVSIVLLLIVLAGVWWFMAHYVDIFLNPPPR